MSPAITKGESGDKLAQTRQEPPVAIFQFFYRSVRRKFKSIVAHLIDVSEEVLTLNVFEVRRTVFLTSCRPSCQPRFELVHNHRFCI